MQGIKLLVMAMTVASLTASLAAQDDEFEAQKALVEYFRAWNAEDNEAIAEASNFPRLSLGSNGQVIVRERPEDITTDFEALRQGEGWNRTTLDLFEAIQVSVDKVHFKVVFSRRYEDGTTYRTVPALYVITRQNGHWGLQLQSLLPATFVAQ